ncbi:Holliday junction resolvase RuvX [Thermospira aquatica]|uniref:Putative pre-16S rRNA nuclease n=1 Tax=Thermospira aquatica TaxID=2828656 RepID=A0AAX3BIM1_9SPIR|nr:Holliday junction resolvase RuvX [Thermospira aquatica]URA11206.1 Holliday junction resolvase RuvX [Thermospira aquatica]
MGRILAIDVGTKKIGLALSDPLRILASPWGSLQRDSFLWAKIVTLCKNEGVDLIVVGYVASDYYGTATRMVNEFVLELKKHISLPVEFQDESFSSQKAESYLRVKGKKKRCPREDRDSLAATQILWEYLDSRR